MNWTEIKVHIPQEKVEEASAIANMTVPYGIYIEDYADLEQGAREIAHIDLIDEALLQKNREQAIIHIYISECDNAQEAIEYLKEHLKAAGIAAAVDSVGVDDADWNENWKKYFKAFEIGERLAICPSWETYENRENRIVLQIDPGAAFGTGTHATTSLCLGALERYVQPGDRVLDIGCGSGILAIASVLLGAAAAVGTDIDAQSVKTAQENAAINHVAEQIDFSVADGEDYGEQPFDIICANIVADVILHLLTFVGKFLKPDGIFIVSGIIDLRAEEIIAAARDNGFMIESTEIRENWYAFCLKK
ncbi:MAG: 50S ribosomal protein L11 methyltransferase [Clostridia bacterium]|nr:50S ribosomal protein L11 methyltransferase [Clostridia bacterium]